MNDREYEEFLRSNEENGSLKMSKVAELFKRSAMRIVVYVLIALIISTSILLMIITYNTEKQYQTKVTFNNKNISAGMTPWDSTQDVDNLIRSSAIVSEAMRQTGFTEEEIAASIEDVLKELSVQAIVTETNQEETELTEKYAFAYTISLAKIDGVDWKRETYITLVENITDTFIRAQKESFTIKGNLNDMSGFDASNYNYLQNIDMISSGLNVASSLTESLVSLDSSFRATSTSKTFAEIRAILNGIKENISSLSSYIISTGVESGNLSKEINYIQAKANELSSKKAPLEASLTQLLAALKEVGITTIVNTDGTLTVKGDSELARPIIDEYNRVAKEHREVSIDLGKWGASDAEGYWGQYATNNAAYNTLNDDQKNQIKAQTQSLIDSNLSQLKSAINILNKTIESYNVEGALKDFVKKTSPAKETTAKLVSTAIFLVTEIVVAMIAVMVALAVTNKKGKINFKKFKSKELAEEKVEE